MSDMMKGQLDPWEVLMELVQYQRQTLKKLNEHDFHFGMQDVENIKMGEKLQDFDQRLAALEAVVLSMAEK